MVAARAAVKNMNSKGRLLPGFDCQLYHVFTFGKIVNVSVSYFVHL